MLTDVRGERDQRRAAFYGIQDDGDPAQDARALLDAAAQALADAAGARPSLRSCSARLLGVTA